MQPSSVHACGRLVPGEGRLCLWCYSWPGNPCPSVPQSLHFCGWEQESALVTWVPGSLFCLPSGSPRRAGFWGSGRAAFAKENRERSHAFRQSVLRAMDPSVPRKGTILNENHVTSAPSPPTRCAEGTAVPLQLPATKYPPILPLDRESRKKSRTHADHTCVSRWRLGL